MNIPSFDEFLATLTDEDMEKILSQTNPAKFAQDPESITNLDKMSAISMNSANFCIAAMFTLLRHYHDWLMKVL